MHKAKHVGFIRALKYGFDFRCINEQVILFVSFLACRFRNKFLKYLSSQRKIQLDFVLEQCYWLIKSINNYFKLMRFHIVSTLKTIINKMSLMFTRIAKTAI